VVAADTFGAGPYSTLQLPTVPPVVEAGSVLPRGTDAVLPEDAVVVTGRHAEAQDSAAPGLWTRRVGEDAPADTVLRRAGERVRQVDVHLAEAAGIVACEVRSVRVLLAVAAPCSTAARVIATLARSAGAAIVHPGSDAESSAQADLVFGLGEVTGQLETKVRKGARVVAGRLALRPGEDGAALDLGKVPVVLAPDRLADALGIWLAIGLPMVRALAGTGAQSRLKLPLTRKISSGVGISEIALLRLAGDGFEPLATGDFPFAAIAVADAWILLAPESEGLAAGEIVAAEPLFR
jgi:molybdopterin biosynthesis enzyme